ncbi:PH domain-containing protein [Polynucleobacter sp. JS-Mosq-20-D10]|mgnify:FL=1|uniref:photosynthetic complex putative assembly protein PuhB n=1 Tax=Polynucleobacter sp. JS-Mosq-20-D10 TaxID=2576922 RepID=UPI001BFE0FAE|nr:photosynthetic complex putative assembly protein PuhB [Polynucleobacter sp. JS-Mosq-20-D10]QWD99772.1 PH domain-containing protein [Polynucleobacter sp. JS-Mosq-20-D10]
MNQKAHQSAEYEFEAALGLPEPLPQDEVILWQGAPNWISMAKHVFRLQWLSLYFAVIVIWQAISVSSSEGGLAAGWSSVALAFFLAVIGLVLVGLLAYWSATTTMYTLTNRRIVMRVGIVLTVTFNLPYKTLGSADLKLYKDGTGDIPMQIATEDKIAFFHLWPHVRPWRLATPEPMMRCVPNAKVVAAILTEAWMASTGLNKMEVQDIQVLQTGVQTA